MAQLFVRRNSNTILRETSKCFNCFWAFAINATSVVIAYLCPHVIDIIGLVGGFTVT